MNTTLITNIVYAVLVILAVLGEHFGFIPQGAAAVIIAAVGGHAVGNTTLVPQATISTEKENSAFVDETQG